MQKIVTTNKFPDWIGKYVLQDIKPPKNWGQSVSVRTLLSTYPLPDSSLLYLGIQPGTQEALTVFSLYTPAYEDLSDFGSPLFLLIAFKKTLQITSTIENKFTTNMVADVSSTIASDEDYASIRKALGGKQLNVTDLDYVITKTNVLDLCGNQISILHCDEGVEVMCLDEIGKLVPLSLIE